MEKIIINGGNPLYGEIEVSPMKNSAVAVLMGSLLVEDKCIIENLPNISDITVSFEIFKHMGSKIRRINKTTYELDNRNIRGGAAPYELVSKMRASSYLMGAELGRFNHAFVAHSGGCDFGSRPIDYHIKGFEALGATFSIADGGYYKIDAPNGLTGAQIFLDFPSVGATINIILSAVKATGLTVIENAAREPHVVDLANFLNACGANISGAGTDVIKIKGVNTLTGCEYAIVPDMIEAGTFMTLPAATGGSVKITNVIPKHLESVTAKLLEMGVEVEELDDAVIVTKTKTLNKVNIKTLPYPGIPTDMNPQLCVLMCLASGTSTMIEGVWDHRFQYCEELSRMGAQIKVDGKVAVINGTGILKPAAIRATDLRAGAAMIVAGLAAKGKTEIEDIFHIERGYENIVEKIQKIGGDIKKVYYPDPVLYEKAN